MILQKLAIGIVPSYKPNAGQYEGLAEFSGEAGNVILNLTPELCDKLFIICAEGILATAKEAAENLTCNVLEHQKMLEANHD